ncbi:unnamed protein product [Periconia digitata]|uniref:DUF7820 domain-containing protein n=1 Tax=Periconia digitata TaxID=1303443 RepID=A0A9W4XU84_9PLEO|nr:unnamed protein product [Periconia digitata]
MQFPRRTLQSIPTLPSIYTSFPVRSEPNNRTLSANDTTASTATVETGIELVPIERSNTTYDKILSPVTDEKEVVVKTRFSHIRAKPLPHLPRDRWLKSPTHTWNRLSVKYRILALLFVQVCLGLTIMGGLLSVKSGGRHQVDLGLEPETPSDVPSIPIRMGEYEISIGNARQQSSSCLARANESAAWACSSEEVMHISITSDPDSQHPGQKAITITHSDPQRAIKYGQLPLEILTIPLTPSLDPESPQNGDAYHFKTRYNRTVLLSNTNVIPPPSSNAPPSPQDTEYNSATDENPWLCFFNETTVEGFIYVSQRPASLTNSTSAWNSSSIITTTSNKEEPNGGDGLAAPPSPFPYTFKLTELRYPNNSPPYCERRSISEDGTLTTPRGARNLLLMPSDAMSVLDNRRSSSRIRRGSGRLVERQSMAADRSCRCQWMIQ